jgi:hypothetical protein
MRPRRPGWLLGPRWARRGSLLPQRRQIEAQPAANSISSSSA